MYGICRTVLKRGKPRCETYHVKRTNPTVHIGVLKESHVKRVSFRSFILATTTNANMNVDICTLRRRRSAQTHILYYQLSMLGDIYVCGLYTITTTV